MRELPYFYCSKCKDQYVETISFIFNKFKIKCTCTILPPKLYSKIHKRYNQIIELPGNDGKMTYFI